MILGRRLYYYGPVGNFSLVVALPDKYGLNKVKYTIGYTTASTVWLMKRKKFWKIHPEWHYCKAYNAGHDFETPEDELLYFIGVDNKTGKVTIDPAHCK